MQQSAERCCLLERPAKRVRLHAIDSLKGTKLERSTVLVIAPQGDKKKIRCLFCSTRAGPPIFNRFIGLSASWPHRQWAAVRLLALCDLRRWDASASAMVSGRLDPLKTPRAQGTRQTQQAGGVAIAAPRSTHQSPLPVWAASGTKSPSSGAQRGIKKCCSGSRASERPSLTQIARRIHAAKSVTGRMAARQCTGRACSPTR